MVQVCFNILHFYNLHIEILDISYTFCIDSFIDDAINANLPVVVLTAYSKNGDKMSRYVSMLFIYGFNHETYF